MGQLIEIVFEALSIEQVKNVCKDITGKEIAIESLLKRKEEKFESNCIDMSLGKLTLNSNIIINNVHLRLLSYEKKKYDIEINFDLDDIESTSMVRIETVLFNYSLDIASRNGINHYFAGIDPANDEETRFFTEEHLGPYSFPKDDL